MTRPNPQQWVSIIANAALNNDKPPKNKELTVVQVKSILYITTSSDKVAKAIEEEAPKYGSFHEPTKYTSCYTLFVEDDIWHPAQVKVWLEEVV